MKPLTDIAYWEENWWTQKRPERLWLYRDLDFETVRLLREEAGSGRPDVLELGAGGSRLLPYLGKRFGYRILGSDFSLAGCRLLRANLALQKIAGSVLCEDLFQSSLKSEAFDTVYSSGLIEHFDDTRAVVAEHLRLVKPGGRVVLIVPNLQGLQGRLIRRFAPPQWSVHRVFGPDELASVMTDLGVTELRSGYLGSFYLRIMRSSEWSAVQCWPAWVQHLVCSSMRLASGMLSFGFRLSPWRPHSRRFSPSFYAAGRKPRA
jgi:SAM-dependent methyltransferase